MPEPTTIFLAARALASRLLVPIALVPAFAACSYLPEMPSMSLGTLKPYRIDIQQGNFLSADMVAQLKTGMTREQVRFVLGTPLVTDVFHADRWDYVYYREFGSGRKDRRRLSVFFEDNKLSRFEGENLPTETSQPAAGEPKPAPRKAPEPAASAEKN